MVTFQDAKHIANEIVSELAPISIVVFGSVAKEGRSLYLRDAINELIRQAEEELTMSKYLLEGGFFKGSCFHGQQSIEKAIKTNLLQKGWEFEKTHNSARLVALCNTYRININLTDDEVVFIDSIYRERYPADVGLLPLGEPKEDDAVKASAIAERMLQHVKNNLQ